MRIVFTGNALNAISFLKAIRAMAYESAVFSEVKIGEILAVEDQIYNSLSAFISNGNAYADVEIEAFFTDDGATYSCVHRNLIPEGAGVIIAADKEE